MQYEPTIKELRNKYEVMTKEKNLGRMERDRLLARVADLEASAAAAAAAAAAARVRRPSRTPRASSFH